MRTEHKFVIWICIEIKGEVKHVPNPTPVVFSTDYFKEFFLLTVQRQFLCCSSSLIVCRWFTDCRIKPLLSITKTCLFIYIENFTTKKKWKFWDKKTYFFHISAQNIDYGHSLEPPRRCGSNEYPQSMFLSRNKEIMYTPVNPSFKVGFQGVKII